jgi:hypothetical protein
MYAFLGYTIYLLETDRLITIIDVMILVILPSSIVGATCFFFTYEFLSHRTIKKNAKFYARRFLHHMGVVFAITMPIYTRTIISNVAFF